MQPIENIKKQIESTVWDYISENKNSDDFDVDSEVSSISHFILMETVEENIGNLEFKKFNEKEFVKDLIDCEGVICNGGFTLISEAIYLNKPILTIPIKKHFEQLINAEYVQEKGYGKFYTDLDENIVKEYILNLHKYNYTKIKQKGNKKLLEVLDKIII